MTESYFLAYSDEQLPQLQEWIMQWRQIDKEAKAGLCHAGDVAHRIYSGTRGRFPLDKVVQSYYLNADCVGGFLMAQPRSDNFDVFANLSLSEDEQYNSLKTLVTKAYQITRDYMDVLGRQDKPVLTDLDESDTLKQSVLSELGFKQGDYWMNLSRRDLNESIPTIELPKGFTIRHARMADYEQLAAVHHGAFKSNWTGEEYLREVMQKASYAPEREMIVVAPDGRFAAFLVYWLDELNKVGLFEPVGAHPDFQRKGLTRALMNYTLQVMKDKGMEQAEISNKVDNPASSNLYPSLGFKLQQRVFTWMK